MEKKISLIQIKRNTEKIMNAENLYFNEDYYLVGHEVDDNVMYGFSISSFCKNENIKYGLDIFEYNIQKDFINKISQSLDKDNLKKFLKNEIDRLVDVLFEEEIKEEEMKEDYKKHVLYVSGEFDAILEQMLHEINEISNLEKEELKNKIN